MTANNHFKYILLISFIFSKGLISNSALFAQQKMSEVEAIEWMNEIIEGDSFIVSESKQVPEFCSKVSFRQVASVGLPQGRNDMNSNSLKDEIVYTFDSTRLTVTINELLWLQSKFGRSFPCSESDVSFHNDFYTVEYFSDVLVYNWYVVDVMEDYYLVQEHVAKRGRKKLRFKPSRMILLVKMET